MQAIAFYLPQYHAIPENEAVYGKNFTEWVNVRKAKPLFPGHIQPQLPHPQFGFYNLLDEKFLQFQHEFAYGYGIEGFCYYYYNLAGKRLLEKPVDLITRNRSIKNRLCLCWDHCNWYDNRNNKKKVILPQTYSAANARQLFEDLLQYFENERYITLRGRPLFCIWAPEKNPMMLEYAKIWRELAIKRGLPGIWLAGVGAFMECPPETFGLDSMIEFAPNWTREALVSRTEGGTRIYSYPLTIRAMLEKECPPYIFHRTIFPGWDNTPRRGEEGIVFADPSPQLYGDYLEYLIQYTRCNLPEDMQFIFINAWNEWGESCALEPGARWGKTFLNITSQALKRHQP